MIFLRFIPTSSLQSGITFLTETGVISLGDWSRHPPGASPRKLTGHVDVLLAGEPDARVKLPHHVLVLPGLPDVLHQARVVQVGAVEPDAERLLGGDRAGAERLHHFPRALAPVAGGERRHGQEQGEEVQGESQRRSPPPVYPHNGGPEE